MLDEEEFAIAQKLYGNAFERRGFSLKNRFKPLLKYYESVTGLKETVPHAIMHHRISQYGPPCENCGKPYRTSKASFCPACGNERRDL